ncbi:MAG TPA: anti-sigma factor [Stellaceae bacterium]|nr:anti-sigma factor [Stellaceae bacterium]
MSGECENLLLVQAEFDGELDAADALRAARHRQDCAQCRDAYAQLEATRALLKESAPRHRAPENLRRAIATGLGARATPLPAPRPKRGWWREGASFALGAALAASIALLIAMPARQPVLDDVVASHIRALQPGHLEDVVSTDEHTVKPWFDGRIDFAPPVKDLAAQHFPLLGGRLDYLDHRPVAALVYGSAKHIIDLYVWPEGGDSAPASAAQSGYNVVYWRENGMEFWAVSDLEAHSLADFVRAWRSAT